jgi:hypothetical protein
MSQINLQIGTRYLLRIQHLEQAFKLKVGTSDKPEGDGIMVGFAFTLRSISLRQLEHIPEEGSRALLKAAFRHTMQSVLYLAPIISSEVKSMNPLTRSTTDSSPVL